MDRPTQAQVFRNWIYNPMQLAFETPFSSFVIHPFSASTLPTSCTRNWGSDLYSHLFPPPLIWGWRRGKNQSQRQSLVPPLPLGYPSSVQNPRNLLCPSLRKTSNDSRKPHHHTRRRATMNPVFRLVSSPAMGLRLFPTSRGAKPGQNSGKRLKDTPSSVE